MTEPNRTYTIGGHTLSITASSYTVTHATMSGVITGKAYSIQDAYHQGLRAIERVERSAAGDTGRKRD